MVEDQGLGIPEDVRENINAFLQNPPDFGVMALSEEARLGLFVVSQLAAQDQSSQPVTGPVHTQANLAPQLAGDIDAPEEQTVSEDAAVVSSAERARNRMSAFRRGTREGRSAPS